MPILDDQILAELAARRFAMPPTVASTGGAPTPVLQPNPAATMPDLGFGAAPAGATPFGGSWDVPGLNPPAPVGGSAFGGSWDVPGILNGATMPPSAPPASPAEAVPLPRPRPAMAPAAPAESAAIPATAALASGEVPATVPETSLMGRLGEAGKRFGQAISDRSATLMAFGGGLAGAPSLGVGIGRGLTAAVPASQLDTKQVQQSQTVRALIARGMPPDVAQAAATNPAILQQLLPQMFGAKALQHVTVKDRMGNEIPLTFDPASGKYKTATGEPYGTPSASGLSSTGDPTKIGPEFMATLDPMTRNEVKAFGEYRAPVTARNLQTMLPLVTQAYPGFDATRYPALVALRKSYEGGGKDFQEAQAINTVSGHMLKLAEAAEALPNTTVPLWNKGVNWFKDTFTGSPELARFRNAVVTTNNELAKAYHGGHVSDAAVAAFNKAMNESQTPADMKAAIGEISGLLQSKIEAKESGFRQAFAGTPLPEDYKATNDEARHAYQKIGEWSRGIKPVPAVGTAPAAHAAPAASMAPPAAPVPPGKYIYDPASGRMVRQQ